MRYIRILIGNFRMLIIQMFSFGKIQVIYPVRIEKNSCFSCRKHGKITISRHTSINRNAELAVTENAKLSIGSYTGIGNNSVIVARHNIAIGDNVMIGPNVCIYDHDHEFKQNGIMRDMGYSTASITIEDNVWIGAGVIVLKGVTIGAGSVIAAGTIITKDIPRNSIVYNRKELVMKERLK